MLENYGQEYPIIIVITKGEKNDTEKKLPRIKGFNGSWEERVLAFVV